MKKIVIIGPAWPLRGGLATFDQRLAKQFDREGYGASIYSFSLQYPGILFPGTSQYSTDPAPEDIEIFSLINSINPFNWLRIGNRLKQLKPDLVIVRYWLPFMGPALGTILRRIRKNSHSIIIAITDNILPHEKRPGDKLFTRYFLGACDGFITMSEKVMSDLRSLEQTKPAKQVVHPLYDTFGEKIDRAEARRQLDIPEGVRLLLFFGFIRKYKGLDLLLKAMPAIIKEDPSVRLLIAGEFYEDEQEYQKLIDQLGIRSSVLLHTRFIPDNQVRSYLCAADVVMQPYRNATQSGVTPLAYHFEIPMVVTDVGGLPAMVPHRKAGMVTAADPASIAAAVKEYFVLGEQYFIPHLREEKKKYSWKRLTEAIINLADDIQK